MTGSARAVMPVVRSGNRVETEHAMNASVQLSNFNKLTASNIPKGSAAYWYDFGVHIVHLSDIREFDFRRSHSLLLIPMKIQQAVQA